ncbi:sensor histidine kinase [uncultured Streptococcus sp.]|uniref:sensor histidine kinase n=1 Tax=uncultured Streptococcus sp. TaxID=83427 RepID=UPI00288940F1|nr:sensor histidine kinase [uncultured Streptococcus sp.]
MLERLKSIHYMFWASLIFMIFPILPVVTGELPSWHLLIDILFVLAYLGVLTTKSQRLSWLCWVIMLAYVAGYTAFVGVNYIWFFFFLANLLIYHFRVRSLRSLHVWTFLLAQVLVVGQLMMFQSVETEAVAFELGILTFVDLMTLGLVRIRIVEDLKEAQAKQNAQINLLLAENERSRIGQDLHDSLGHTFAMLSVKTDLALQLFQMEAYPQVEKELKEIHQISKDSMNEVRTIVENLKSRTLTSELETVKKMLEIAGIEVEIANQLDTASLTQELESTASMILLELVTNIIKHAKASKVYLKLERTEKELILTVRDDGCGFTFIKGDELHTIRERVLPFSGEVNVISQKQPTEVQVRLAYKERN